ncbi:hypothetical protein [Mailhella sp.]|uniref:hypothetical protein n=1 Tax=Mailhella sp. TaxID=1981029 RepID=UPI004064AC9E
MSVDFTGINKALTEPTFSIDEIVTDLDRMLDDILNTLNEPDETFGSVSNPGLPTLPAPAGPLSLDTLLSSIGDEVRRQTCRDGVASIEIKGEQQAEINKKELEELAKQLEKMKRKGILDGFLKIFQVIGMVVGAIASAASLVVGAATGNPLLIAAGVAGIAMTVDSALGMATGGKICISGGIAAACEAAGMEPEKAQLVGMGISMALNLATIALNIGGAARMGSVTAEAASKVISVLGKTTMISSIVGGVNSMAQGATTIASGVYSYQIAESRAAVKDLEAILERIRTSIEMDRDMVEAEMQRANDLLAAVNEIVESCNATLTSVLTMNPAMA